MWNWLPLTTIFHDTIQINNYSNNTIPPASTAHFRPTDACTSIAALTFRAAIDRSSYVSVPHISRFVLTAHCYVTSFQTCWKKSLLKPTLDWYGTKKDVQQTYQQQMETTKRTSCLSPWLYEREWPWSYRSCGEKELLFNCNAIQWACGLYVCAATRQGKLV